MLQSSFRLLAQDPFQISVHALASNLNACAHSHENLLRELRVQAKLKSFEGWFVVKHVCMEVRSSHLLV